MDTNGSYTYVYDNRDRMKNEIKHDGSEPVYGYDDAGNRTTLSTVVAGITNTATYSFDALNRMASVTDNDGNTTIYEFDANSNQTRIDQANNTATTMEFDDLNRVTTITHRGTAGETLTSLTYSLDDTGRRTAINESAGRSSNYTYDELYRLTGEAITDNEVGNHSASYEYNAVSNRIADTVNGTSSNYTYDDNDRLTGHGQDSYSYDDNGNTMSEVVNGQSNSYSYDSQNRLTEATMGGVVQAMAYDPDGVRIQKSTNGDTTDYLTDSNRDYAQVLYERSATSELNYTFGTDLVGLSTGVENFTYHTDALGSTRLLTDDSGDVADDVRYDAWGEVLSGGDVGANQYLYTGEQFDGGLGKTYLRARYYDAGVGRFSQMDTWLGLEFAPITQNSFLYSNANPVLYTDPTGQYTQAFGYAVEDEVVAQYKDAHPYCNDREKLTRVCNFGNNSYFGRDGFVSYLRPDIFDFKVRKFNEIKPLSPSGIGKGAAQLASYSAAYGPVLGMSPNVSWTPESAWVDGDRVDFFNVGGVIFYTDDESLRIEMGIATLATVGTIFRNNARKLSTRVGGGAALAAGRNIALFASSTVSSVLLQSQLRTAMLLRGFF